MTANNQNQNFSNSQNSVESKWQYGMPKSYGLYDNSFEHDACGVGFVCDIDNVASHEILDKGIEILNKLVHRGATSADGETGDGAGISIQLDKTFHRHLAKQVAINIPEDKLFATGIIFCPHDETIREGIIEIFNKTAKEIGIEILGWRKVPVDTTVCGDIARSIVPTMFQPYVIPIKDVDKDDFEKMLYTFRRKAEVAVDDAYKTEHSFYVCSLSSKIIIYKGMLMPYQLKSFYLDLGNELMKTSFCVSHSRFSTNTLPTWDLAHPFRCVAHNGEINSLFGNRVWCRARESELLSDPESSYNGVLPLFKDSASDSASLDATAEFLMMNNRTLLHAMRMLVPPAWENDKNITEHERAFFKYHASITEPWDGPATIVFSNGDGVGAITDRSGLRPARYILTNDNMFILASEIGVSEFANDKIIETGSVQPGQMLYIDLNDHLLYRDKDITSLLVNQKDYTSLLEKHIVELGQIPETDYPTNMQENDFTCLLSSFGYGMEDVSVLMKAMIDTSLEAIGAGSDDTPLAVLSKKNPTMFRYFKQKFAQVTNPPVDSIRESFIMSYQTFLGDEIEDFTGVEKDMSKKLILVKEPIITNETLEEIIRLYDNKWAQIDTIYDYAENDEHQNEVNFAKRLSEIQKEAVKSVEEGFQLIILSDKGANKDKIHLPSLLALSAVHSELIDKGLRKKVAIIIESGEPRSIPHYAMLFAYGADAVYPYIAFSIIKYMTEHDMVKTTNVKVATDNYIKTALKGLLKVISKIGISTLQSYKGSQLYEALGLGPNLTSKYFRYTVSRIGGLEIPELAKETWLRHKEAYSITDNKLPFNGAYSPTKNGEKHAWVRETTKMLFDAASNNDKATYDKFAEIMNNENADAPVTLRDILTFNTNSRQPVPISEVEPVEKITKRFFASAMSFGALSIKAHEDIAIGLNRIGGLANSGEGGEDPNRNNRKPNGDLSAGLIKQVAAGRFGVDIEYLINAKEIQVKIAQGAKPGEGGQLPGVKVTELIAKTRKTIKNITLISPPPHHDIYSIEDLAQLIYDLKCVNSEARINVKLTSSTGIGTIAAGVAKAHAESILVSGGDGGTGASPLSSIKYAGLPLEIGLTETHQTLILNGLRNNVVLQTDGQLRTGKDIAIAAMLGAEEFGFGTALMVAVGCTMCRQCHTNTCHVGICTQDDEKIKSYHGNPQFVVNYLTFIAEELRNIMSKLGVRTVNELVGQTQMLKVREDVLDYKSKTLDLSKVLMPTGYTLNKVHETAYYDKQMRKTDLKNVIDYRLIALLDTHFDIHTPNEKFVYNTISLTNANRSVGASLSSYVFKNFTKDDIASNDFITFKFKGIAGQSFGAFLTNGITLKLKGYANDYVGKGLSGGTIAIARPQFNELAMNLVGNTCLYGATSGKLFVAGLAGERFAVRNSGADVVIEGVGSNACEYMTGGHVVILGTTGKNFLAGMSGGIVYCNVENALENMNNPDILVETLTEKDEERLEALLTEHYEKTNSTKAKKILTSFNTSKDNFVRYIPKTYKDMTE